jgi:hypothetical protein
VTVYYGEDAFAAMEGNPPANPSPPPNYSTTGIGGIALATAQAIVGTGSGYMGISTDVRNALEANGYVVSESGAISRGVMAVPNVTVPAVGVVPAGVPSSGVGSVRSDGTGATQNSGGITDIGDFLNGYGGMLIVFAVIMLFISRLFGRRR